MNIIQEGNRFTIHGNELQVFPIIPAGTYKMCFSMNSGYYLTKMSDIVTHEKVYGWMVRKVEKTFNAYKNLKRNTGVILSGKQGSGKTLFTKIAAQKAKEAGMPTIIIQNRFDGIGDILSSIDQRCLVIFDEFEKNYNCQDQESLLPIFDGLFEGEKLFLITCNAENSLSRFILNRPGRFLYHFKFGELTIDEVKEYLSDNLLPEYRNLVKVLTIKSILSHLSYDSLRSVAQEINNGYDVDETFRDLNIEEVAGFRIHLGLSKTTGTWYDAYCRDNKIFCNAFITEDDLTYKPLMAKLNMQCEGYINLRIAGDINKLAVDENGRYVFPWEEAECEWTIIDDSDENEKRIVVKNNLREIFSEISITSASTTSTFGNPAPFLEF